ncbi:UPF0746 protein DDB_G0281095-like [Hydractinia symbiolongicarpus]|uniref:UPF0746 protein DDB_G0281095-like n=1 Tax=Hydractinia symbiolongicarpus TaxID=13093 RepID=UPI00254E6C59|nr:UPF0746 protein DDB_G0281095-like [Hydractinia symbiolongicarpus]
MALEYVATEMSIKAETNSKLVQRIANIEDGQDVLAKNKLKLQHLSTRLGESSIYFNSLDANKAKLYHGIIELLRKRNEKKHNLEDKQDQINSDGNVNWLKEFRYIGDTEKRVADQQQLQQLQKQILKQQQEQLLRQQGKRKQQQKLQEEEQKQKYLVDLQQMMLQLLQKQKQLKKDREKKLLELQFLLLQQRQIEKLQLQYQQNN